MPGSTSPAGTLLVEDALNKIIYRDGSRSIQADKRLGFVPLGSHSCFGDFPPDLMPPKKVVNRGQCIDGAANIRLQRPQSAPAAGRKPAAAAQSAAYSVSTSGLRRPRPASASATGRQRQTNTSGDRPPSAGATRRRPYKSSMFRYFYERGDLPVQIYHGAQGKLFWKVPLEKLDYHHYLPIFFDGLREKEDPYRFMAVTGCYDMLSEGGSKVLPVVPQLVIPIKAAMNTRDPQVMCTTLKVIQELVKSADHVGEALVPYYRQILPVMNIFKSKNIHPEMMGDQMDFGQRKRLNLGDLIAETLQILEEYGGEDAYINIKYMIPTYESTVLV